jgi:hypothetical protein
MHEIRVSVVSPEAADHGVAELWAAGELIGYTILDDGDLMLRIEPRHDHGAVVLGARSLAQALGRAEHLLETYCRAVAVSHPNGSQLLEFDAVAARGPISLEGR